MPVSSGSTLEHARLKRTVRERFSEDESANYYKPKRNSVIGAADVLMGIHAARESRAYYLRYLIDWYREHETGGQATEKEALHALGIPWEALDPGALGPPSTDELKIWERSLGGDNVGLLGVREKPFDFGLGAGGKRK